MRIAAYLLAFVGGACAMYGWQSWAGSQPETQVTQAKPDTSPAPTVPAKPVETPKVALAEKKAETPAAPEVPTNMIRVGGITEPAPGRFARLPLATSQAIAHVDVKVGDRVKKGWQVFSHWESPDRLEAVKVEAEKAKKLLGAVKTRYESAEQTLARLNKLKGSATAQEIEDAKSNVKIREHELRAAELGVTEAERRFTATQFEFTQAFVTSPIDGIVAAVDVALGERRQVGGAFRGVTILDASVLHCRCLLSQEQLNRLPLNKSAGDKSAATTTKAKALIAIDGREWPASVVSTGLIADPNSGMIPVVLEVQNTDEALRVGSRVTVSFQL